MGQLELIYVLSTSFSVNPVAYVSSSFPSGREGQAGAGGWGGGGVGQGGGRGVGGSNAGRASVIWWCMFCQTCLFSDFDGTMVDNPSDAVRAWGQAMRAVGQERMRGGAARTWGLDAEWRGDPHERCVRDVAVPAGVKGGGGEGGG